ncbi:MAG: MoxR family ATPase [Ahniella sp.]|nr:MoxR family ATPase [Ahniella sp.]
MGKAEQIEAVKAQVDSVLLGKSETVRMALACLLAGGHLLIEDVPGVGKTTLAHALAASLGLQYQRIQFTSDLLPSDILGVSVYQREHGEFRFHPGPIFSQLILADEINRATPKTQSALLEAMAEQQVTIDGQTRALPQPFFVVATQNPVDLAGTFPLPDSQLDRFLMRLNIGYPAAEAEREMLAGDDRRDLLAQLKPILAPGDLQTLRQHVRQLRASGALVDYVQRLLAASRVQSNLKLGLSPRAGLALLAASRGMAFLAGRDFVLPEDVQQVFVAVTAHRMVPTQDAGASRETIAAQIQKRVAVSG